MFFLVQVGRGVATEAVSPQEYEDICHFLYDTSQHGVIVRTVEAPFFRRAVARRRAGDPTSASDLYQALMGPPTGRPRAHNASTRDGKGDQCRRQRG